MKYKIRMLKSVPGVDDGDIHPTPFTEGGEYEIGKNLYDSFVEMGVVELVDSRKKSPAESRETKVVEPEELKEAEDEDTKKKPARK